ncbi:MAG: replication-relaxation family protein [Patescibacteria group bacterium]
MKLPNITKKQQTILELLYTHRFLNRIQIQTLMNHSDYKRINVWLKDLREKQYVAWIYSTDFAEKTKPAVYYLGINGIRFLKTFEQHPIHELRKRYREPSRSQTYIDRCMLIADCCITLEKARTDKAHYYFETEADYLEDSYYHFLSDNELVHPHLCFSKEEYDGAGNEEITTYSYLLEVFDPTLPRYRIKKRLKNYAEYLDEGDWESETDTALPIILLVCPRTTDLIYAKRRTRSLMTEIWESDDDDRPQIRFATVDKLKAQGVRGEIWEEA